MSKLYLIDFFYCCPGCPSDPSNAIHMGQATWVIWVATTKGSINVPEECQLGRKVIKCKDEEIEFRCEK